MSKFATSLQNLFAPLKIRCFMWIYQKKKKKLDTTELSARSFVETWVTVLFAMNRQNPLITCVHVALFSNIRMCFCFALHVLRPQSSFRFLCLNWLKRNFHKEISAHYLNAPCMHRLVMLEGAEQQTISWKEYFPGVRSFLMLCLCSMTGHCSASLPSLENSTKSRQKIIAFACYFPISKLCSIHAWLCILLSMFHFLLLFIALLSVEFLGAYHWSCFLFL